MNICEKTPSFSCKYELFRLYYLWLLGYFPKLNGEQWWKVKFINNNSNSRRKLLCLTHCSKTSLFVKSALLHLQIYFILLPSPFINFFNFVQFSILSNFQFCQFSILSNFEFCAILNFVQFCSILFNFVQFCPIC